MITFDTQEDQIIENIQGGGYRENVPSKNKINMTGGYYPRIIGDRFVVRPERRGDTYVLNTGQLRQEIWQENDITTLFSAPLREDRKTFTMPYFVYVKDEDKNEENTFLVPSYLVRKKIYESSY